MDGSTAAGRTTLHTGQAAAPGRWHVFLGDGSGGALLPVGPAVATDAFQVHTLVLAPGAQQHRIGGGTVTAAALPSIGALGGIVLGARYSVSNFLDGDVKELLVYDRVLTSAEVDALEGYLFARHGRHVPIPPPTPVDVFVNGDGVYPRYRIPAIVRTAPNGVLLAFAEGRQSGSDQSENDIVVRRSFDSGASWGPVQLIADVGRDALNNPCAVRLHAGPFAGRVLVMYQRYPLGTTIWNAPVGISGAGVVTSWLAFSDDEGATWSTPIDVTAQVKPASVARAVNSGPGRAIQLRHGPFAGRIVVPFNRYDVDGTWGNYCAFSDDGGLTWQRGSDVPRDPNTLQGNECQVVERADGSVLLNSRHSVGTATRKVAVSTDGGATFSPLRDDPALPDPACMASVLRFTDPADGLRSRILFAGPRSTSSRVNGSVWVSHDEGSRWATPRTVYAGGFAYCCLTEVDARRFGVLFEADSYAAIRFVSTTVEWVSAGADCLGGGLHGAAYGRGCAGTGGLVPELTVAGCPTPGARPELVIDRGRASAVAVVNFGLAPTAVPIGPCELLVGALVVSLPLMLDANGTGLLGVPIPGDLGVLSLYCQGLVLDPGAALGLTATPGREVLVF
ncbi:MAG: exo-alpha-sialidase [Planctomycetes bacterium]|nr:exo-alpha-sialidase [Planctomycetota bacterium]